MPSPHTIIMQKKAPPQLGWKSFDMDPEMIPPEFQESRSQVEKVWRNLNIIFAAVFHRNPAERPDAITLRDNLKLLQKYNNPTLEDFRSCNAGSDISDFGTKRSITWLRQVQTRVCFIWLPD